MKKIEIHVVLKVRLLLTFVGIILLQDPTNQNNIISEVYTYCHHEYEGYWFVSIYIYKGLLLAFGTFLAWETRHVVVPGKSYSYCHH